ncbi:MAG: FGGY family carbohydrate kinase, partial [Spartobacteria bacterium]
MITLGIDCGTQSLKTVALDGDSGKVIASASKAYGLVEGLPAGHLEQDPAIWWDALEETVQKVLADLGSRKAEVAGIGVSGQQHGFVPLDANHQVIRPAKLWCDTSTTPQCD